MATTPSWPRQPPPSARRGVERTLVTLLLKFAWSVRTDLHSPASRGWGDGTVLVRAAPDGVRVKRPTLTNFCEFVGRYLQAHPEYRDLLDTQHPGTAIGG